MREDVLSRSRVQTSSPKLSYKEEIDLILDDREANIRDELEIESILKGEVKDKEKQLVTATPSEFTEFAIKIVTAGKIAPFRFSKDRRYLRQIYDTSYPRVLLKSGRQTEKSMYHMATIRYPNGKYSFLKDVEVGDQVFGLNPNGPGLAVGTITWKSEVYNKRCIYIKTCSGFATIVALTHPMRVDHKWVEAGELSIGDKVAVTTGKSYSDLWFDEVIHISDVGTKPCYDISVDHTDSFIGDGFVTHNSTLLGNISLSYAFLIMAFKVLYVSATNQQAEVFSKDRIKEPMDLSNVISALTTSKLTQNVLFKQFLNRSQIRIRYAFLSADRVRGISSDMNLIDEIQDIIAKNIPVIEQCMSHSEYKIARYSGTPKSMDNTIQVYWDQWSTQNEWVIPCDLHVPRHWNILGEKNIGRDGLICAKCGSKIHPEHPDATWASMQPRTRNNEDIVTFDGYRVPQLMVPWITKNSDEWRKQIIIPYNQYERPRFYNEVLGLSYDSGTRPLTRNQIIACCKESIIMGGVIANAMRCAGGVAVGIDWGCHDDQTRILTDSGFKFFRDLAEGDKVAQFDRDTRVMSFVSPIAITSKYVSEDLYHTTGRGIDMMLTGSHRMLIRGKHENNPWRVTSMSDLYDHERVSDKGIRGYVDWEGERVDTFTLPGLPKSPGYGGCEPLCIDMDVWLELLGYFLSEGGLCYDKDRPSCVKMSQRAVGGDHSNVEKIRNCMDRSGLRYSEFFNPNTLDYNWTFYGKQLWQWWLNNIGSKGCNKRIPRQFINLSKQQLKILFDAMMFGDGSIDKREGNTNGGYPSTSIGLCEDFQELCIRLGLKVTMRLSRPAEGNRKDRYTVSWSRCRDLTLNVKNMSGIKKVPYKGTVYCCKVPSGFIVTERNGCISYQGNTGENRSFSVISLGGYIDGVFQIFYSHRFVGQDLEPHIQLEKIAKLLVAVKFKYAVCDYGGGFHPNAWLIKNFGAHKIFKMMYHGTIRQKVKWEPNLRRMIVNKTEVLSDFFFSIKRKQIWFPRYEEYLSPHIEDMLNVFSEYNEKTKMIQYMVSPGKSDDTLDANFYCFMASYMIRPRPDILRADKPGDIDMPLAA